VRGVSCGGARGMFPCGTRGAPFFFSPSWGALPILCLSAAPNFLSGGEYGAQGGHLQGGAPQKTAVSSLFVGNTPL